jgi:putative DNA primase/helicase
LGSEFGLAPLIGKPLATVSDGGLGGHANVVIERLLSISGEDALTINRKFKDQWTGQLPTRFMILSNELPRFGDASGAIATRFMILTLTRSWLGKENTRLTPELLQELPSILLWALEGLDELTRNGQFTVPKYSDEAARALQDLVSPLSAFVRDRCEVGTAHEIPVPALFAEWRKWCDDNGHKPTSVQTFSRDLRAVLPALRVARPRAGEDARQRHFVGITLSKTHNAKSADHADQAPDSTRTDGVGPHGPQPNPLRPQLNGGCGDWGHREMATVRLVSKRLVSVAERPTPRTRFFSFGSAPPNTPDMLCIGGECRLTGSGRLRSLRRRCGWGRCGACWPIPR